MSKSSKKITPFLWFNDNAEEAMNFYSSIFKKARIKDVTRYGEAGPDKEGTLMTATIELEGQELMVLNGGPTYEFTEAISFFVRCETQKQVDYYWEKLSKGGEKSRCGWLKDQYGVSWQIIPRRLEELLKVKEPHAAQRVMKAMLKMNKIEIKKLEAAFLDK